MQPKAWERRNEVSKKFTVLQSGTTYSVVRVATNKIICVSFRPKDAELVRTALERLEPEPTEN